MECGSIDLAGFLRKNRTKITENELRVFWRQMLEAVHVIHEARIIHSDLKPANFLLVEGRLKLIDFGIANALQVSRTAATKFLSPLQRLKSTQRCFLGGWGNPLNNVSAGAGSFNQLCACIHVPQRICTANEPVRRRKTKFWFISARSCFLNWVTLKTSVFRPRSFKRSSCGYVSRLIFLASHRETRQA